MTERAHCVVLPWDSEFFGLRIGRVVSSVVAPADVKAAVLCAQQDKLDCLYALVDVDDAASRGGLEACGFRPVDERLTLTRAVGTPVAGPTDSSIRPATVADAPALAALARVSHRNTRFYNDGRFDRERCDELYAVWITQALSERDAIVLVSGDGRDIAGYFSLHALSAPQCRVGLVAVGAASQGQGVGRALMTAALQSAAQHGVSEISVVTQGTSNGAVRYYESAGFRPDRRQIWYHHWLPESVRDARD